MDCSFDELQRIINERHPDDTLWSWGESFELEQGTDGYQFHVIGGAEAANETFYVWIFKPDPYMEAHEFHHLAHDILFTRGVGYSSQSEEAFAFLTGRLYELYQEEIRGAGDKTG